MPAPLRWYDDVDYKIIKLLQKDVRMPSLKIANEIGVNERTVRRRIDRLVENGAIKLTAICDSKAFGYNSVADIFLSVPREFVDEVVQYCSKIPCVAYMSANWSNSNLVLQVRCKNSDEMFTVINETLPSLPNVKVENYHFVPKILLDMDGWMPAETDFWQNKNG